MTTKPLITLVLTILLSLPALPILEEVNASQSSQRLEMACNYLNTLYNPTVHLVRETLSSNTYWISSDNLLADRAFQECGIQNDLQSTLNDAGNCCLNGRDFTHESFLGENIPLPIHDGLVYNKTGYWIANFNLPLGNYNILWESHVANDTGVLSSLSYADIGVYTALQNARDGNRTGLDEMFQVLHNMWDGKGMIDEPFKEANTTQTGIYQTYKNGLYLALLVQLGKRLPYGLTDSIFRMQGTDGGFHTGYNSNRTYQGDENAETTSIAIIALSTSRPSYLWLVLAVLVVAAASIVTVILFWKHWPRLTGAPARKNPSSSN